MARGFQSTRERSTGLTLIELLVVIAILAILAGLLLPAVQSARETARRTHCQNHLKQIGLALHHYNDTLKRLPPGWIADDPLGEPGWGLLAYTLPFLELGNLHDQIDFHSGIAKTVNQTGRLQQIPGFLCPSDRALDRFELGRLSGDIGEGSDWEAGSKQGCPLGFGFHSTQVSPPDAAGRIYVSKGNYSGVFGDHAIGESLAAGRGLFYCRSRLRLADIHDGTSTTLLMGEKNVALGPVSWVGVYPGADAPFARHLGSCEQAPNAAQGNFDGFRSHHPQGANFSFADGSVRWISETIEVGLYQALSTQNGSEIAGMSQ